MTLDLCIMQLFPREAVYGMPLENRAECYINCKNADVSVTHHRKNEFQEIFNEELDCAWCSTRANSLLVVSACLIL